MNDATFDNLTRLLGARPSRRQVLKGIVGGGTLAVAGLTRVVEETAAQCLEDGEACTNGAECCGRAPVAASCPGQGIRLSGHRFGGGMETSGRSAPARFFVS
jgi:hypothetical protein